MAHFEYIEDSNPSPDEDDMVVIGVKHLIPIEVTIKCKEEFHEDDGTVKSLTSNRKIRAFIDYESQHIELDNTNDGRPMNKFGLEQKILNFLKLRSSDYEASDPQPIFNATVVKSKSTLQSQIKPEHA